MCHHPPTQPCPDLVGRVPLAGGEGSPRKLLIFLFHWRTMLDTERAPDSGSEEVVLAETSAPESSMAAFWPGLPVPRSDMGLARRRSADTCPEEEEGKGVRQVSPAATFTLRAQRNASAVCSHLLPAYGATQMLPPCPQTWHCL